jgi:hypothetical protein
MFPDGNALRVEYGKALSCHERALLFARDESKLDAVTKRAEPPAFTPGTLGIHDDISRCRHITTLYLEASTLLYDRLYALGWSYEALRKQVGKLNKIPIAGGIRYSTIPVTAGDRDFKCSFLSLSVIAQRIAELGSFIEARNNSLLATYSASAVSITLPREDRKCYVRDWAGLDKICQLLMEEIAYVRARSDEFNKTWISYKSIRNAIWAIVVTILAILANVFKDHFSPPKNDEALDQKTIAAAVMAIPQAISDLKSDLSNKLERPLLVSLSKAAGQNEENILNTVKALEQRIKDLENSNDKGAPDFKAIGNSISDLNKSISSANNPVILKMDEIGRSLAQIKSVIETKKFPSIQIPRPAPVDVNIRTIGWTKAERPQR